MWKATAKNLMIHFSIADKNYAVGYINAEIVSEFVQEPSGDDMFGIEPLFPMRHITILVYLKLISASVMTRSKKRLKIFLHTIRSLL